MSSQPKSLQEHTEDLHDPEEMDMSSLSWPGEALDLDPSWNLETLRSETQMDVTSVNVQDRVSDKALVLRLNGGISSAANNRCHMPQCAHRKPFRHDSEMRRHMATHTRPFSCKEKGCATKPFGDKPGLMRHMREVHGQHTDGQASQTFKCPELNCKRHLRGFPREFNMLSHYRRIHEEPITQNIVLERQNPEGNRDQTITTRPGDDNTLSGSHSRIDDTSLGTADSLDNVHRHEQSSSETTLQVLRAQLSGLEAQREEALRTFDQKIVTMSTALRLVEEGLRNTTAVE